MYQSAKVIRGVVSKKISAIKADRGIVFVTLCVILISCLLILRHLTVLPRIFHNGLQSALPPLLLGLEFQLKHLLLDHGSVRGIRGGEQIELEVPSRLTIFLPLLQCRGHVVI